MIKNIHDFSFSIRQESFLYCRAREVPQQENWLIKRITAISVPFFALIDLGISIKEFTRRVCHLEWNNAISEALRCKEFCILFIETFCAIPVAFIFPKAIYSEEYFIFRDNLQEWVNNEAYTGDKQKAAIRIMNAFIGQGDFLKLSDFTLNHLPPCIGNLPKLKYLCLDNNQITALPDKIGNLAQLTFLNLNRNNLTSLPNTLTRLTNLGRLYIDENPQLSDLPLGLDQLRNLMDIGIEGTLISPDLVDTILKHCQNLRREDSLASLPNLLEEWKHLSQKLYDLSFILAWDASEQQILYDWLIRLVNTADFETNRKALASILIEILRDLSDTTFRKTFIAQASQNNERCGDRAAMAFNELFLHWKLFTLGKQHYRLQIGDRLIISLYGFEEGNTLREVAVEPTGNISYLFIGSIPAVGKTIDQLRNALQHKIQQIFPTVLVAVTGTQLLGDQYTILGEVNLPGTKYLFGNMTLLQAISDARGFPIRGFRNKVIDYADLEHAFLARDGEFIPVDFQRLVKGGDITQNLLLKPNDYIFIPSLLAKQVYVLGEVRFPAIYSYMQTATLAEVIAWSGGTTYDANCRVVVIRGSLCCPTQYIIDFHKLKMGCCRDFLLQPGDIVFVPPVKFAEAREILRGAIRTFIGAITLTAGIRAFEAIQPKAKGIVNNGFIVNPGTTIITTPVIAQ